MKDEVVEVYVAVGIFNYILKVPGASKLIIPGIGHTAHKEARALVLEHAAGFINSLIAVE